MGNAQSRRQHDAEHEFNANGDSDGASSSPLASHRRSESDINRSSGADDGSGGTTNSHKRRRGSTSADPAADSTAENPSRTRRRRASPRADSELQHTSTHATPTPMDLDAVRMHTPSATASSNASASRESATLAAIRALPPQSDLQQRYAAVQSRTDASPGVGSGATPPHLDVLRDERDRARRQILEALGAPPTSATTVQPSNDTADVATAAPIPAAPVANASAPVPPNASASATIAALLGAAATASASQLEPSSSSSTAPSASTPTTPTTASASQSHSQQNQQQQRPQPVRPQAFRVPLQPEMISGTSMVVQGALVARLLANRPTSPETSASQPSDPSESDTAAPVSRNEANTTPPPPSSSDAAASTAAEGNANATGATLEGEASRGAVTLQEQAVMLSRILGIAAAATAASLLNTSEAQHVDPSLLQTSLRRPFERMNQANNDRNEPNERWLADWQRNGTNQRPPSNSSDAESIQTQSRSRFHPFSSALRRRRQERFDDLARRSADHVPGSEQPGVQQGGSTANSTSEARSATAPRAFTSAADGANAQDSTARQQEIIAHLLSAAQREAASQRLPSPLRSADQPAPSTASGSSDRARSSGLSASATGFSTDSAQQESQPRSLSRLIRSTIGSFLHPSRLLPSRNAQSSETSSSGSRREGWTYASTSRSRSGSSTGPHPSSDFSLGPNDVAGTLRQVRNGVLPDGVPGSFGSFLNHLVNDLMAAVQLMRPSTEAPVGGAEAQTQTQAQTQTSQTSNYFEHATQSQATSGAEILDGDTTASGSQSQPNQPGSSSDDAPSGSQANAGEESLEAQARRQRDFQNGNLSFFRLFRFDPVAPSQLVPCIVVGVRSLSVMERFGEEMTGARAPGPGREFNGSRQQTSRPTTLGSAGPTAPLPRQRAQSEGAPATSSAGGESTAATNEEEHPASRFMLFVSGGRYPPNHPLLTSNPATAGRDLMILMDLLSTMQAMQQKPSTVTQQEIDASNLLKIKGSQVAAQVREGKITENMAERCLVCLEDWQDQDDCRVLACRHAFHTLCVDKWMTSSSNTCPMCRRQGVSKDGQPAGAETADSRRAAQT